MAQQRAAAKEEPQQSPSIEDLYAGFSKEELAEFFGTTGQEANLAMDKTPILKVNYCDLPDKTGRSIKKGNFVLSQNSSEVEVEVDDGEGGRTSELRVEDIGIDLGKSPKITVLAFGYKYVYYPPPGKDKKTFCSSQLVFDRNKEIAVGSNLKFECSNKINPCPRRSKDADRKEQCSCQWVVFCDVPLEDGTRVKAVMYAKGKSYMPFSDYIKSAGTVPLFFAPTKLTSKMERDGSVTYFVMGFELLVNSPYSLIEIKEHGACAKGARDAAEQYKQLQLKREASKQIAHKDEGLGATIIKDDNLDDIAFD